MEDSILSLGVEYLDDGVKERLKVYRKEGRLIEDKPDEKWLSRVKELGFFYIWIDAIKDYKSFRDFGFKKNEARLVFGYMDSFQDKMTNIPVAKLEKYFYT